VCWTGGDWFTLRQILVIIFAFLKLYMAHRILPGKYCKPNCTFIERYASPFSYMENAAAIENALLYTLEQGIRTGDFGDKNIPSLNTTQFAEVIINNFGKGRNNAKELTNKPAIQTVFKLEPCWSLEMEQEP
jgi:hypothetical protein